MENADNKGKTIAVIDRHGQISYKEIADKVSKIAGYLKTIGIRKGNRVIIEAVSNIDYVIVYLALQYIGAISAPVERGIKPELLKYMIDHIEAKCFICKTQNNVDSVRQKVYTQ